MNQKLVEMMKWRQAWRNTCDRYSCSFAASHLPSIAAHPTFKMKPTPKTITTRKVGWLDQNILSPVNNTAST